MSLTVGFIGFGEVGSTFSAAMRARGVAVAACDIAEDKVTAAGGSCLPLSELAGRADYLLSAVTAQAATGAAASCVPYLRPRHVYVDLNSTSPAVKLAVEKIIRASGAHFVEGAILGAVGVEGAGARILLGGPSAQTAAQTLTEAGLHACFYSEETGKASTFKMLRGIFSKGLEALLLELLIAGKHAGIEKDLWADVAAFMARNPFERVAGNWLRSHAVAHDRRYHELVQVTATMREIGMNPLMAVAAEAFFDRSRALGLDQAFPARPDCMEDVVAFMEQRLCGAPR